MQEVRFSTCLRQKENVRVVAHINDSLEGIAVRLGMRRSAKDQLKIVQSSNPARRLIKLRFLPGDTVVAPFAPEWTPFVTKPDAAKTRAEVVDRIAEGIGCGAENHESCLARRSIVILEKAPAISRVDDPPMVHRVASGDRALIGFRNAVWSRKPWAAKRPLLRPVSFVPASGQAAATGGPRFQPVTTASMKAAIVDPQQWPYDVDLVARILASALPANPSRYVDIGVADNGLANADGGPLSRDMFVIDLEKPKPASELGSDSDNDGIADDFIGGGVLRDRSDLMPTGDVALCNKPAPDFSAWKDVASHGAIVSSIAAGRALRKQSADLSIRLPRVMFFRTSDNDCSAKDDSGADEPAAIQAIEFLANKNVAAVNFSALMDGQAGASLARAIDDSGVYGVSLYVFPATDRPANLDGGQPCPQCLGDFLHGKIARYVVVVGAATSDRNRSIFSGWGNRTVRLYAPAEPLGALDILAGDASRMAPATSYAAPLASLAIGIIKAEIGNLSPSQVRARLFLSTWEMKDPSGATYQADTDGVAPIGILDLVKAAGATKTVVEAMEQQSDGRLVLHTYVGNIVSGFDAVCPEGRINTDGLQAMIFGEPDGSGARILDLYARDPDTSTRDLKRLQPRSCTPSGTLQLTAVRDGNLSVPFSSITKILFPIN